MAGSSEIRALGTGIVTEELRQHCMSLIVESDWRRQRRQRDSQGRADWLRCGSDGRCGKRGGKYDGTERGASCGRS